jgi:hypothetical protein
MVDWLSTASDCVDVTYIRGRLLDQLPTPAFHHLGTTEPPHRQLFVDRGSVKRLALDKVYAQLGVPCTSAGPRSSRGPDPRRLDHSEEPVTVLITSDHTRTPVKASVCTQPNKVLTRRRIELTCRESSSLETDHLS